MLIGSTEDYWKDKQCTDSWFFVFLACANCETVCARPSFSAIFRFPPFYSVPSREKYGWLGEHMGGHLVQELSYIHVYERLRNLCTKLIGVGSNRGADIVS